MMEITARQWEEFDREGFLFLGQVATDKELADMQQRIDDIMLGLARVNYDQIMMQLDREPDTGRPGPQTRGHKGSTLLYRKIQQLEFDPFFLSYMRHPIFQAICQRTYGQQTPVSCYRAMFMNKPAEEGTDLAWHQDRWDDLDQDPEITIYTALDSASSENGCVHVIPRSHRNQFNSYQKAGKLNPQQLEKITNQAQTKPLELSAGEVVLLHNWTLHKSGTNRTQTPRRAFSVCYMRADTKIQPPQSGEFPIIFGEGSLTEENLPNYQPSIIYV